MKNRNGIYLYKDKQLEERIDCVNDKRRGKYLSWYKNGQKRSEVEYLNDKKNGKEIRWYDDIDIRKSIM